MNIDNLNKLIARMAALPPTRIDMRFYATNEQLRDSDCRTAGCIAGWCIAVRDGGFDVSTFPGLISEEAAYFLGIDEDLAFDLFKPSDFKVRSKFPAHRVIATLKRLRDTYLSTGQVVVDWGPEPSEEPKQAWTAPQVAEVINPALPAELTSLLRNTVEA